MKDIVFVHLGSAKVRHLWKNIKRIKKLFPDKTITVIYSDSSHKENILQSGAEPFLYNTSDQDEDLLSRISQNRLFREGFWRFSLERLLALEAWHSKLNSDSPMLHLESDILIFGNFPFKELATSEKLSWIQVTETHDVSAILFSPSAEQTKWLTSSIRKELINNSGLTDMTVLNQIRRKNPKLVSLLPTLCTPSREKFQGIFDGASLGMWLTGRDPRNNLGIIRRHLKFEDAIDQAGEAEYSFNNGMLFTCSASGTYPIYNLHVHSKRMNLFNNLNELALRFDLFRIKYRKLSTTISIRAAWAVLVDYHRRNGFKLNQERIKNLARVIKSSGRGN